LEEKSLALPGVESGASSLVTCRCTDSAISAVSFTFIRCCRDEYYINERERDVESIAEGWVKVKCHGTRERRFIAVREKEHPFVRRFPGFARSSF
jgi:hypothetical protein